MFLSPGLQGVDFPCWPPGFHRLGLLQHVGLFQTQLGACWHGHLMVVGTTASLLSLCIADVGATLGDIGTHLPKTWLGLSTLESPVVGGPR